MLRHDDAVARRFSEFPKGHLQTFKALETRALREQLAKRVTMTNPGLAPGLAPGVIASEGMNAYPPEVQAAFAGTNPMKRFGEVEDVANAIAYLAGETGRFITGEVLTIDGGHQLWGDQWTIPRPDYFGGPQ